MKILKSEGCTAFYTMIDGVELSDLSAAEQDKIVDVLFGQIKIGLKDGTVLFNNLLEVLQPDESEYEEVSCDQCGDSISRKIWNFEE